MKKVSFEIGVEVDVQKLSRLSKVLLNRTSFEIGVEPDDLVVQDGHCCLQPQRRFGQVFRNRQIPVFETEMADAILAAFKMNCRVTSRAMWC